MLLYNVTIIIEEDAAAEWLQYMQEKHIPEVLATGMFISNRLLKVLDSPNEGITYCSQYVLEDLEKYQEYQQKYAAVLQEDVNERFKNRFVAYRTLMEFID